MTDELRKGDSIGPFRYGGNMDTGEGDPFGLQDAVFDALLQDTARQVREHGQCAAIATDDLICLNKQPCPEHESLAEEWATAPFNFGCWDKFTESEPAMHARIDRVVAQPSADGWYVVYIEPDNSEPHPLLEFAPRKLYEAVTDLDEAWTFVDFCIDEDLGEPLAIKNYDRVIYFNQEARGWIRVRSDYPEVSTWL